VQTRRNTEGPGVCGSCAALIIWATTERLKLMPVDVEPVAGGTIAIDHRDGRTYARVVDAKHLFGRTDLHKSHFATCPDAGSWRRKRGAA